MKCPGFRKKKYVRKKLKTTLEFIAGPNTFPLCENKNAQHPILYQLQSCSHINKQKQVGGDFLKKNKGRRLT